MSGSGSGSQPQSQTSRNPRRRARATEDTGSVRHQPQRKRSKISRDTFKPPETNGIVNGDTSNKDDFGNGRAPSPGSGRHSTRSHPTDMVHRTQPKASSLKSTHKDDGSTTLTSNAQYSVKKLPGLPALIKNSKSVDFRGARVSPNGYALMLTRQHALAWDYNTPTILPPSQSLTLPHPAKADEPIPLGAFVYSGASTDTGLVVVNPSNGKISFWESIENADALSLFEQRRNGIEGSCGSLMYGETVIDITDAGAAGFVLSFSSGRTAHLQVRDSQSRPSIAVQFLRKGGPSVGVFDSIKNIFGAGGWLRSVAAVQTFSSTNRGQTEAVICSEDATIQFWQLNWTAQAILHKEINAKSVLTEAAAEIYGSDMQSIVNTAKVVDIAHVSGRVEECNLVLLVCFGNAAKQSFALVNVDIGEEASSQQALLLHSYSSPIVPQSNWKPKLCLLKPASAVVVVFEKAITFAQLDLRQSNPNNRDVAVVDRYAESFQDTVYFREDTDYVACGVAVEQSDRKSTSDISAIVFVQGFGLLRFSSKLHHTLTDEAPTSSAMSAKSKIEQAVYFESVALNPLDLRRKSSFDFPIEEVETAAESISRDVLGSRSPFIPAVAASVDAHLSQRAQYLKTLATYIRQFYPNISRTTKWNLRWDAEKLAAAREVWTTSDSRRKDGQRELNLLYETILSVNESFRSGMDSERGENDILRHFFIRDVFSIGTLLGLVWKQVQDLQKDDRTRDDDKLPQVAKEANDLLVKGLETAFILRDTNAEMYGLEHEDVQDGLLSGGYNGLPEFWTSQPVILISMIDQIEQVHDMISLATEKSHSLADVDPSMRQLALSLVQMIDLYCKVTEERLRWEESRDTAKGKDNATALRGSYLQHRLDFITSLPNLFIDLAEEGMRLAEKYGDLQALVGVIASKSDSVAHILQNASDEKSKTQAIADDKVLEQKIAQYFKKYPGAFSYIQYSGMIQAGKLSTLLDQATFRSQELTGFLRKKDPVAKKFSWINEVLSEKNNLMGAKQLVEVATDRETDLWNKKVELSIAKLALTVGESAAKDTHDFNVTREVQKDEAAIVKVQEMAYDQVRPCLYHALDKGAELEVAMEHCGQRVNRKKYPHLRELLERAMERLIQQKTMNVDQLIDLLSLMSGPEIDGKQNGVDTSLAVISGQESFLALTVLKHASAEKDRQQRELLLKIIWRRCFIRDDWSKINKTGNKTDKHATKDLESTTLFKTLYEGYAQDLWSGPSGIRILYPREVLGAGTKAEEHADRFKSSDLTERLAKDMLVEDKELAAAIDKSQLEGWVTTAKGMAERRWAEESERKEQYAQLLGSMTEAIYEEDADLK